MPTTPNGLPYPAPGDVPDGAAQIKALAEALPVHRVPTAQASGSVSVPLSNAAFGTAVVTFPVGRFTLGPRVMATVVGTSVYFPYLSGTPTPSSVTIGVRHNGDTAATQSVGVQWHAVEGLG
jgi:hypothetical protein